MARGVTAKVKAETQRPEITPVVFYEGEFTSGTVRVWTGAWPISWNGQSWEGLGAFVGLSPITESTGLRADGIVCTLSGVPNGKLQNLSGEFKHSYVATLWLGFLDRADRLVADPTVLYFGKMGVPTIKKGRKTSTISITYEKELLDKRGEPRRYTHEDLQIDHPGDLGHAYVNELQDKTLSSGVGNQVGTGRGPYFCFSGNTKIVTPAGAIALAQHVSGAEVMTKFGPRPATLVAHEFNGAMLDMGGGELVTHDHEIQTGSGFTKEDFTPALDIWNSVASFTGAVYDLVVETEVEEERHFLLANGRVAHNKRREPVNDGS
jgi:hypothetical protein